MTMMNNYKAGLGGAEGASPTKKVEPIIEDYEFEFEGEEQEEEYNGPPREEDDVEPPKTEFTGKRDTTLDFQNVMDLSNFISKVKLAWPENHPSFDKKSYNTLAQHQGYPRSYFSNTSKEKAVFWHAENFRRQFEYEFPDRRPLFIAPTNECGFQKLFPTYIRPRLMPFAEFFYAESCVEYFKDFFNNDFLDPCTAVPTHVRSHIAVLKDRKANCYEISVIIASILIGAGYRAYVVDGYATKEITTLCALEDFVDTFQEPEDNFKEDVGIKDEKKPAFDIRDFKNAEFGDGDDPIRPVPFSKYRLKMEKPFISCYQEAMKERVEKMRKLDETLYGMQEKGEDYYNYYGSTTDEEEEEEEVERKRTEGEKDPLYGYRVHAWILILPGSRDVLEPYFLEPFTGTKRKVTDDGLLGIEAVFNHKNYWINLQDCQLGVGNMNFDLENLECWSKLLLEPPPTEKGVKEEVKSTKITMDDEEGEEIIVPDMFLDMPVSWTIPMEIRPKDFKTKFPHGTKDFDYNDALVSRSAPYGQPDGCIQKVLKFDGNTRKASKLLYVDERFAKRQDKLIRRKFIKDGRIIHEYFDKGRPDALKEHIFFSGRNKPHTPRHLYYYSDWHNEGASHRQVVPNGIIEYFENRSDHLYYRKITFGDVLCMTKKEKTNKIEELKTMENGGDQATKLRPARIILGIVEKYDRDPKVAPDYDIAEKHMLTGQGQIRLIYHYPDDCYTRTTLEFFKPDAKGVRKENIEFIAENCVEFHVSPFTRPLSNYKKSVILKEINADESKMIERARLSEDEIVATVTGRVNENWHHKLDNEEPVEEHESNAASKPEIAEVSIDEDEVIPDGIDFASTYLVWGEPEEKSEEISIKKRIMLDAKDRIKRMAEYIMACYKAESEHLKDLLKLGCSELETSIAQSEGYEDCFQRILFRIHVMEKKLIRFQAKAPRDYCDLLVRVLQHPLLNRFALQEQLEFEEELERQENLKLLEFALKLKGTRKDCCQLDYFYTHDEKMTEDTEETSKMKEVKDNEEIDEEEEDEDEEEEETEVGDVIN